MEKKYRLTVTALFHIQRLPPERRLAIAGALGRLGYVAGTSITENWKADYITIEKGLEVLCRETGLPPNKILQEVKPPRGRYPKKH